MKKPLIIFMLALILSGCTATGGAAPSDVDMATRVAKILTAMPTATGQVTVEPTVPLPTLAEPTQAPTLAPTAAPVMTLTNTTSPYPAATEAPAGATATPAESTTPAGTAAVSGATATVTATAQATPNASATVTPTAGPSATPPAGDPRTKLGDPKWTDKLDNGNNWPGGEDKYTQVDFKDGAMVLTSLEGPSGWRLTLPTVSDFYLEATIRTGACSGMDRYGLIVRVPDAKTPDQGYLFGLSCDGKYNLAKWNGRLGAKGTWTNLVSWSASKAIQAGANQTNRLGFWANGTTLIVYVNGVKLSQVTDDAFREGNFGVFVGANQTKNFAVSVDEISYWDNLK